VGHSSSQLHISISPCCVTRTERPSAGFNGAVSTADISCHLQRTCVQSKDWEWCSYSLCDQSFKEEVLTQYKASNRSHVDNGMVPIAGQGPSVLLKGFRRLPDHLPAEGMNGAVPTSTLGLRRQALTAIQWHQMVQYPVHKSPPPVPIPSQMNPVNAIITYDFLSSVLLSRLRPGLSSAGLCACHLSHTCYMLILLDFVTLTILSEKCDLTELPGHKCPLRCQTKQFVRFHVLMAASMKIIAFSNIAPCRLELHWHLRGAYGKAMGSNLGPDTGYPVFHDFPQSFQANHGCLKN
jgi:hypothetical protein